jgi:hypothetical protein
VKSQIDFEKATPEEISRVVTSMVASLKAIREGNANVPLIWEQHAAILGHIEKVIQKRAQNAIKEAAIAQATRQTNEKKGNKK